MPVKIIRPSLDDFEGQTIIRGIIARESLPDLRTDFYQRELLPLSRRKDIWDGLNTGTQLPDVELGMRGDKFEMTDNDALTLIDSVFIVDGQQRISTLKEFLVKFPEARARLGAIVHTNTNPDWERNRFHKLNTARAKVSSNVILRNLKDDEPAVAMLYGLSVADKTFVLYNRVCWAQHSTAHELLHAVVFARMASRIHSHLAPVRHETVAENIASALRRVTERIGLPVLRENTKTFWNFIDEVWGIKELTVRHGNIPYLFAGFLSVLVDFLSDHVEFWQQPQDTKLVFPYDLKQKFKKFPVYDPEIVRLSGVTGKGKEALYFILMTHINSGKKTRRLVPRNARTTIVTAFEDDENANVA